MKNLGLVVMLSLFTGILFGQSKMEEVKIKTSSQCGMCKTRIEEKLNYTKGVKYAELDVASKEVTVKFNTEKTSKEKVIKVITDLGYHADNAKRSESAHDKLPGCCQSSAKPAAKSCCSSGSKSCSKEAKKTTTAKACCSKDGKKSCSKKK